VRSQAGPVETGRVEAGDPSFVNNIPNPRLAGDELPSVKRLLASSSHSVSMAGILARFGLIDK
jgi:hypothetical protein